MEASRNDKVNLVSTLFNTLKQLLTNPLTISIILGFIANLTNLQLPVFVEIAVSKMAGAALPVALFGLGAVLVSYKIASQLPQVSFTCFIKLILHPLLAFVTAKYLFDLPHEIIKPIVLIAAMPSGMNAYVFATMYDKATGNAASTILFSTLLSIVTITFWLSALG
jgi:predicted permease